MIDYDETEAAAPEQLMGILENIEAYFCDEYDYLWIFNPQLLKGAELTHCLTVCDTLHDDIIARLDDKVILDWEEKWAIWETLKNKYYLGSSEDNVEVFG